MKNSESIERKVHIEIDHSKESMHYLRLLSII